MLSRAGPACEIENPIVALVVNGFGQASPRLTPPGVGEGSTEVTFWVKAR